MLGLFDPMYLLFVGPAMLLAFLASARVKSTFSKYSRVRSGSGLTGAQAAHRMLQSQGISDVAIERVQGFLSDHYDPMKKTLRLSPDVYNSPSLSAIGVACHEAGHALQHARNYAPLSLRTALVPVTQIGSGLSYFVFIGGMLLHAPALVNLGCILFSAVVLFSIVTLPVEWDASARAKKLMTSAGIVTASEQAHAGSVLNAAFLTYVASAVTALMTLLYYLFRAGLLGGGDD